MSSPEHSKGNTNLPNALTNIQIIGELAGQLPPEHPLRAMNNRGLLAPAVVELFRKGIVSDAYDAMNFLTQGIETRQIPPRASLAPTRNNSTPLTEFGRRRRKTNPLFRHGILGHEVMALLNPGMNTKAGIEEGVKAKRPKKLSPGKQIVLFEKSDFDASGNSAENPGQNERLSQEFLHGLEESLFALANDPTLYQIKGERTVLYQYLRKLFPEQTKKLLQHNRSRPSSHDPYILLSLMTWGQMVLWNERAGRKHPFFSEIPIFDSRRLSLMVENLSGGRIDSLEVTLADGSPITGEQVEILEELKGKKHKSVGHLARELQRSMGQNIEFVITDWKMFAGDGPDATTPLDKNKLSKPLDKHLLQVKHYLTLASASLYLLNQDYPESELWNDGFNKARLVYFLPDGAPIEHVVEMTPSEKADFFKAVIIPQYFRAMRTAERKATDRNIHKTIKVALQKAAEQTTPGIINSGAEILQNGGRTKPNRHNGKKGHQHRFGGTLETLIEDHSYLDPTRVLKITDSNGHGPKYSMDFGRLIKLIQQGEIEVGSFSLPSGGTIKCLNPKHDDRRPSLHVFPETLTYKCFSCGSHGSINLDSVPENIELTVKKRAGTPGIGLGSEREFQPPSPETITRHHKFMGRVAEILSDQFSGSDGEKYLKARRIDIDLAKSLGAGYDSANRLIKVLRSEGFTVDDLRHFGIIGFSHKVNPMNSTLIPLLIKSGLHIDDIVRNAKDIKGQVIKTYPFSTLGRRVTFPLAFEGASPLNFYGRLVHDKGQKHTKLSTLNTGMPQGIFNPDALLSGDEIIVVEGVMDAMSLMMLGYKGVCAFIGVDNIDSLRVLAASGKKIGIGLDNDKTGRESTDRVTEKLMDINPELRTYDFTKRLIEKYPGMTHLKDANLLLQSLLQ